MKGHFLLSARESFIDRNIYADKSSLILDWLLQIGITKEQFSLREVCKDRDVSIGLVQRVFQILVLNGFLQTTGVRTAKKFSIRKPELLLKSWLDEYNIVKKCKMWTYKTGFQGKKEIFKVLEQSRFNQKIALALHSAAEAYKCKNTNLETLELYMLDPSIKPQLEKTLHLEPQERGYEVLLIEPYYKSLLAQTHGNGMINLAPLLLTFLDLYHFPLRGQEQAEFMSERIPELKRIYKKD